MLSFLKEHPFGVEAIFNYSLVLTFAIPKDELISLLPPHLELDTFDNTYGFLAVAMVDTKKLRPKGFPAWMGQDFFLTGYRIFVRYTNPAGRKLRGLYILHSETNKKKMQILGNLFTHYNYSTTDINSERNGDYLNLRSKKSGFDLTINMAKYEVGLPDESPFADWKTARRYAGPLPFTFHVSPGGEEVLAIEGVRTDWNPIPVEVVSHNFNFIHCFQFTSVVLANAFIIHNVPYAWKKGKKDVWAR